ncbi:Dynamin-related protein [Vigna angularis]|uniref:Dynamin-related protein n=1 Tax=Phaseolus angularis TaxID=3914 RepID=A0A8T0LE77_PHAAN|nr:Dynamin-related protein [Vigna angularis]
MAGGRKAITKAAASSQRGNNESVALVHEERSLALVVAPIVSSYNERIRPVLDAMENLRRLNIAKEGIQLPSIVVVGLTRETLIKILLRGEFDEYPEERNMHCTARLVEMLDSYSHDLYGCPESDTTMQFLMDEIKVLEEAKWIGLPNFMPRIAFLSILQKKVRGIRNMPIGFVENVWNYLENVLITVITRHCDNYHQLLVSAKRAAQVLISKKKQNSTNHVKEAIEMEMYTDYTCNPEFSQEYIRLISQKEAFVKEVLSDKQPLHVNLKGVGKIDAAHLRQYPSSVLNQAFDLKVRMISYWKIVQKRLIDIIALHLMLSIHRLVNCDLQTEIVQNLLSPSGGGIERLLEESPSIAGKREKLSRSVRVLRESKETVGNIIDRIGNYGDF